MKGDDSKVHSSGKLIRESNIALAILLAFGLVYQFLGSGLEISNMVLSKFSGLNDRLGLTGAAIQSNEIKIQEVNDSVLVPTLLNNESNVTNQSIEPTPVVAVSEEISSNTETNKENVVGSAIFPSGKEIFLKFNWLWVSLACFLVFVLIVHDVHKRITHVYKPAIPEEHHEVKQFILESAKRGFDKEEIETALVRNGWPPVGLDKFIEEASRNKK